MLKIAYCDDDEIDRKQIMSALCYIEEKWKDHFEIMLFKNNC